MDSSLMEGRIPGKRAPLTNKQKKHRWDNDLCMYCGDAEHKITECFRRPTKRGSLTDSRDPQSPVSPKKLHRTTGATAQKSVSASKNVGFLKLPRELRNRIYEELLSVDEFQIQQFRAWRKLNPQILGVNSQIYHEASGTLYDENGWVTLTAGVLVVHAIACEYIGSHRGFPGDRQPVERHGNDRLSKSAILDIRQRQGSDVTEEEETVNLVIPLAAMPRFCRLLAQSDRSRNLDLVLRFNTHAKTGHQNSLLGSLGQARGLRRVVVIGTEQPWVAVNTAQAMTTKYKRLADILNTVSAYRNNSECESRNGRMLAARNLIQDGADFVDWWLGEVRPRIAGVNRAELDELLQARAEMGYSCASLYLRSGSIGPAQEAIKCVIYTLAADNGLSEIHKACAHFYMAQSFETVGWKNAAVYSYLQALRFRPGYQDADAAVDQLEKTLGSGMAFEDVKVKHNIQHVLGPLRHQPTDSPVVKPSVYNEIFWKFDGTAPEIRSLGREVHLQTDLVYLNPEYKEPGYDDDDQFVTFT